MATVNRPKLKIQLRNVTSEISIGIRTLISINAGSVPVKIILGKMGGKNDDFTHSRLSKDAKKLYSQRKRRSGMENFHTADSSSQQMHTTIIWKTC